MYIHALCIKNIGIEYHTKQVQQHCMVLGQRLAKAKTKVSGKAILEKLQAASLW